MSTGGLFVCGIIAARNLPKMQDPVFMESFLSKGRMRGLLEDMPVKIVLNDDCGLMGSARYTLVQKAFGKTRMAS
jgi:glucokinase